MTVGKLIQQLQKLDRPEKEAHHALHQARPRRRPEAQGGPLVRTLSGDEGLDLSDPGYGE